MQPTHPTLHLSKKEGSFLGQVQKLIKQKVELEEFQALGKEVTLPDLFEFLNFCAEDSNPRLPNILDALLKKVEPSIFLEALASASSELFTVLKNVGGMPGVQKQLSLIASEVKIDALEGNKASRALVLAWMGNTPELVEIFGKFTRVSTASNG